MTRLRLLLAACVMALSLQSASAVFYTTTYGGPAVPVPDSNPAGVNINLVVPDGIVMSQFQDVTLTFSTPHTWVGDLAITLTHVESGATITLFNRPGRTSTGFGDSTNFAGPYTFSNIAALTNPLQPRIIDNASTLADAATITSGVYRPTTNSFAGTAGPAFSGETITSLNSTFDGMGSMAGTWRLSMADFAGGDTGSLGSWSFTADVTGTPAPAALWMGLAGLGVLGGLRRRFKA